MSLKNKILNFLSLYKEPVPINKFYEAFPNEKRTTVRGRVYEALGKGIVRLDKNLYISSTAIIEKGNSLKIIDRLIQSKEKFDYIFLDIPYEAAGQKGGNRNLFDCDKISVEDFKIFSNKCIQLLRTEESVLSFMFTSGKSSKKEHDAYLNKISLKQCSVPGTYKKLWSNGNPMNMGKYLMPVENIYFFTKSGYTNLNLTNLNFELVAPIKEYPTAKPYELIKELVSKITKKGQWVFDPFGGSGKILKACLELNRKCHIIDSSETSFNNHLKPILYELQR
jgi:DNA modification methylase